MSITTLATPGVWLGFVALVIAVVAIDLGIFNAAVRKAHVVKPREALVWTGVWVALALSFNVFVWKRFGAERFKYVQPGLALVLVFVGVKMALSDWVKIPVLISLAVIVALVGGSILISILRTSDQQPGAQPR
jgi:predicted tellurium resistance membrane protein TerC